MNLIMIMSHLMGLEDGETLDILGQEEDISIMKPIFEMEAGKPSQSFDEFLQRYSIQAANFLRKFIAEDLSISVDAARERLREKEEKLKTSSKIDQLILSSHTKEGLKEVLERQTPQNSRQALLRSSHSSFTRFSRN